MLTVIDEYSRFPFAFPIKDTSSSSVLACLRNLFSLLGTPAFIHSDRGRQFVFSEFNSFCHENGISHSCTTPYHPSGNGQTERFNGTIWTAIRCILHSQQLGLEKWEDVLPQALASIRTLVCSATNETPHSRLFRFDRRGSAGFSFRLGYHQAATLI